MASDMKNQYKRQKKATKEAPKEEASKYRRWVDIVRKFIHQ